MIVNHYLPKITEYPMNILRSNPRSRVYELRLNSISQLIRLNITNKMLIKQSVTWWFCEEKIIS